MRDGNTTTYNVISLIFLVLTVLTVIFVIVRIQGPEAVQPTVEAAVPTAFILPSVTPTSSPTSTQVPTFTFTPTDTLSPTPSLSPTASMTVSPTITETATATETPPATNTPENSPTPTPTETPTGPTPTHPPTLSPYLYDLRQGQVIFTQNFANAAGCAWQGIGGQVFDINGSPLNGLKIHVFNTAFDRVVDSGTNSLYGPGGWEVPLDNKISPTTYFVELLSPAGTVISPRVTVIFPSDCARNVGLVNFIQTRQQ
ncbi:MAG: hypothetical protein R3E39_14770 [Anaerolineae bacterium]